MLGERLRNIRMSKGMTQEQVAAEVGVSRQSVGKWEDGSAQPDLERFRALARVYDINLGDLVNQCFEDEEPCACPTSGRMIAMTTLLDDYSLQIPREVCEFVGFEVGCELVLMIDKTSGIAMLDRERLEKQVESLD